MDPLPNDHRRKRLNAGSRSILGAAPPILGAESPAKKRKKDEEDKGVSVKKSHTAGHASSKSKRYFFRTKLRQRMLIYLSVSARLLWNQRFQSQCTTITTTGTAIIPLSRTTTLVHTTQHTHLIRPTPRIPYSHPDEPNPPQECSTTSSTPLPPSKIPRRPADLLVISTHCHKLNAKQRMMAIRRRNIVFVEVRAGVR